MRITSWSKAELAVEEIHIAQMPALPDPKCVLPRGAGWAVAKPDSGAPFNIAVNLPFSTDGSNDDMSYLMRTRGYYEVTGPRQFQGLSSSRLRADRQPNAGVFLDVGANLGDWGFMFAAAGWRVIAVEGGDHNVALMNATLCANPYFQERFQIAHSLVGSPEEEGKLCAVCGKSNGHLQCSSSKASHDRICGVGVEQYDVRIKTLKTIIEELAVPNIDAFKLDIEGHECQALAGYDEFASQQALVWAFIETTNEATARCVQEFAARKWTRPGDGGRFDVAVGDRNTILSRERPFMLS